MHEDRCHHTPAIKESEYEEIYFENVIVIPMLVIISFLVFIALI